MYGALLGTAYALVFLESADLFFALGGWASPWAYLAFVSLAPAKVFT